MDRVIILGLFALMNAQVLAQQADSLAPTMLKAVTVEDHSGVGEDPNLRSVEQFAIYKGKKTEVITMNSLIANVATNNPRQIYGRITGLNIWESDGAGLQLGIGGRGLSPNRTANFNTRQNGYDISADALGYPESYYTPPAEAVERIEIVRGAASLQFGTQFGGLLNFRFKRGPTDKKLSITSRQTLGSWGFRGSFNSIGGTIVKGKLNYYAYYQYKTGDGWRPNSGFDYHCGFANISYKITARFNVQAEVTKMSYLAQQAGGLTDKLFQDDPRQSIRARNWFQVAWNMAAIHFNYDFSDHTKLNIRSFGLWAARQSVGNLERINVADLGGNRTLIDGQFKNLGQEGRLLHQYDLGEQPQTFLVGYRLYRGNSTARQGAANSSANPDFYFLNPEDLENSDFRFPNHNEAVFLEHIFNLSKKWSITPGIRFEHIFTASEGYFTRRVLDAAGNVVVEDKIFDNQARSRSFIIGGVGATCKPSESVEFYGNISQNYRAINFTDLRIINPNYVVDTAIRDERGFTADLGIRSKKEGFFNWEITAFYIAYNGRIGQVLKADQPPLYNDYRFRSNISDARNLGLEVFGEADLLRLFGNLTACSKLKLFINAAVVEARYVNTQDASILNKKVEMAPPLMLRTGLSWQFANWKAGGQVAYIAKHFSDATNSIRTSTAVEGIIPAYTVADLSVSWRRKWLTIEGSCNNLLNTSYFTRRAESYPGPGIIPSEGRGFYVTLGVAL